MVSIKYMVITKNPPYSLLVMLGRAYSSSLLRAMRAIIARNHLLIFKLFSNFVHFCPNFQIFCPFLPFFGIITRMPLLSRIGPVRVLNLPCLKRFKDFLFQVSLLHVQFFSTISFIKGFTSYVLRLLLEAS